jgi:hypothetical protein
MLNEVRSGNMEMMAFCIAVIYSIKTYHAVRSVDDTPWHDMNDSNKPGRRG